MRRIILLLSGFLLFTGAFGQSELQNSIEEKYSSNSDSINFTPSSASKYIIDIIEMSGLWRTEGDSMKLSLGRLVDHFKEPIDSVEKRLSAFEYDSIRMEEQSIIRKDSFPVLWLNDTTFIVDTVALDKQPFIIRETITQKIVDTSYIVIKDSVVIQSIEVDSIIEAGDTLLQVQDTAAVESTPLSRMKKTSLRDTITDRNTVVITELDTIREIMIDSAYLKTHGIRLQQYREGEIYPDIFPEKDGKSVLLRQGARNLIITDSIEAIVANPESPFYIVPGRKMPDSLQRAVETLMSYTYKRDSILINITDIDGQKSPLWLTAGKDDLSRYWVKNHNNDSITIWMGNPSKNSITLLLEEDVNLKRMTKEEVDIPVTMIKPDWSLAEVKPLEEIPIYWNYDLSSSFILNQTFLSNWSKGGQNAFSSLLDMEAAAEYTDTKNKIKWINSGRLKFGTIIAEEKGLRVNTDMLELNSKYNKVIKEKIDFSSVFYFKTQLAAGYNYPNDSVKVSKFLSPGTFTVGAGLEYKPFKKTTLNFSPLSYKNTFVLNDSIDETLHGIEAGKTARQEMGGQLVIKNKLSLVEDLNISNSIRLFSNYLDKPQNVDVDWEMNIDKRINWYFRILLNLHLIYDHDVRFPVLGENDEPVTLPDGSVKKVPKTQFKQFLGLTFSFKF